MKEELIQALLIVQITMIAIIAFVLADFINNQQKELALVQKEISLTKKEITKTQEELKHNDNIMLKVLEKEW